MRNVSLLLVATLFTSVGCKNRDFNSSQQSPSPRPDNMTSKSTSENSVAGYWKSRSGRSDYLYIGKNKGFLCASDLKSDSIFELNGNTMENGDYFSGDKLTLDANGSILIRRGEDKGSAYEVKYTRTNETLPDRCVKMITKLQGTSFSGSWKKSESGKNDFLYIASTQGFICASDIKSDSTFELNGNTMENGDYFSGDKLSLDSNGNTLIRRGEDKGSVYEIKYTRTNETLPDRCLQKIKELR